MSQEKNLRTGPLTIAIGGGKGGVGKSMISSNLAVQYAQQGLKTIILDLDFGGANLHTLFGVRQASKCLGQYFSTPRSQLKDYLLESSEPKLQFISATGLSPEQVNLKHMQKAKLMRHIRSLDVDLVLLDLGAGSTHNIVDFFSMTDGRIVVTTPEPTAILNAYEFLKNAIYRIFFRMFRNQPALLATAKQATISNNLLGIQNVEDLLKHFDKEIPWLAETIRETLRELSVCLILNQAQKPSDADLARRLNDISMRHLNLPLTLAGMVFYTEEVPAAVLKMSPISHHNPDSVVAQSMKRISGNVLREILACKGGERTFSPAEITDDYTNTLLSRRRLQRDEASFSSTLLAEH